MNRSSLSRVVFGVSRALHLVLCSIFLIAGAGCGGAPPIDIDWHGELAAGRRLAAERDKPMLVEFTAVWCAPCQVMKREVWTDPEVQSILAEDYVAVRIDADESPDLTFEMAPEGLPTLLVFRNGVETRRHAGLMLADDMAAWLRNAAN